jgi:hypothetical protein
MFLFPLLVFQLIHLPQMILVIANFPDYEQLISGSEIAALKHAALSSRYLLAKLGRGFSLG